MTNTVEHTYMLNAIEIVEFASYSAKKFLIVARASDLLAESANPVPRTVLPIHANLREPKAKSAWYLGVTNFTYATKIRYQAQVSLGHKKVHIGSFSTDIEAAQAYDLKIVELRGEGGITNFPVEGVKTNVLFPDYPATKRHEVH